MKYKIISDCWVRAKPVKAGSTIELNPILSQADMATLKDLCAAGRVEPIEGESDTPAKETK